MIAAFSDPTPPVARSNRYAYLDRPAWDGGDPDKPRVELVDGTEVEKQMGAPETLLANVLNGFLFPFVRGNGLGESYVEMDIELPAVGSKRFPDVVFVSYETWPRGRRITTAWWAVTPDLAVEVVSPYALTHATFAKVHEYFAAGVKAVWLVLPNVEQVYCYTSPTAVRVLGRGDELTGDPVVPGFRLPLADLFPPPAAP